MDTLCYFDMFDRCIGYLVQGVFVLGFTNKDEAIATGLYSIPLEIDPMGMDAATLWYYRKGQ